MRFVIYGAGAVGSYFGAKLQQANHEVVFIARGKTLEVLQNSGLTVYSVNGDFTVPEVQATDDPAAIEPVDYIILCMKTWQVEAICAHLPPLMHEHTQILTLQNGVEVPPLVGRYVGMEHVLGGVVRGFFFMEEPGTVRHPGVRPTIIFGAIDHAPNPYAQTLLDVLLNADVHAEIPENIDVALWNKFMMVTSLSGIGAVTRATLGAICENPVTRQMLADCMTEIWQVAQAYEIPLDSDIVAHLMSFVDGFPYDATTSMQRDVMEGRPSELEFQTGTVVRMGNAKNVPVALNAFIYASLLLQEQQART